MKSFLIGAAKIASGLFLAGLGLLIVGLLYMWSTEKLKEREARPLEQPRAWLQDLNSAIGLNVETKTKLVGGRMLLNVTMRGSPQFLSNATLLQFNQDKIFQIHFLDGDGFKIASHKIPFSDLVRLVNADGNPTGMSYQGEIGFVDPKQYSKISSTEMDWTILAKLPELPQAEQQAASPKSADHCAPGISRQERLKRLATKGTLRETGLNDYSAGSSSVLFGYDGALLHCR